MDIKEAKVICRQIWGGSTPYRVGRVIGAKTGKIPSRNPYLDKTAKSQENFDKGVIDGIRTRVIAPPWSTYSGLN